MDKKTVVALVGGTGDLGLLIAKELLNKPGVQLRLLVRPESKGKAAGKVVFGFINIINVDEQKAYFLGDKDHEAGVACHRAEFCLPTFLEFHPRFFTF